MVIFFLIQSIAPFIDIRYVDIVPSVDTFSALFWLELMKPFLETHVRVAYAYYCKTSSIHVLLIRINPIRITLVFRDNVISSWILELIELDKNGPSILLKSEFGWVL